MTDSSLTYSLAPAVFTEREAAEAMRLSRAMLQKLRRQGGGPAYVRIGSAIRYPSAGLAEWLRSLHAK